MRSASSQSAARCSGESAIEGANSTTFWWRRCTEQSRSKKWTRPPWASPTTWTSRCLGFSTYRSRNTAGFPKAAWASLRAETSPSSSSFWLRATRMPRPPPPAAAFTMMG